jgi:glycosyltransferase involved in cell wall biosynthesis
MAEVTAMLAPALPKELQSLLSFEIGPGVVEEIAAKLVAWLTLDDAERERASLALAREAARRYSWENVAEGVIAAAQGRLDKLQIPPATILRTP